MGSFDQNPAAHDSLGKQFQLGRLLSNNGLDRRGRRHVAKRHLQWKFDGRALLTRRLTFRLRARMLRAERPARCIPSSCLRSSESSDFSNFCATPGCGGFPRARLILFQHRTSRLPANEKTRHRNRKCEKFLEGNKKIAVFSLVSKGHIFCSLKHSTVERKSIRRGRMPEKLIKLLDQAMISYGCPDAGADDEQR